MAFCTPLGCTTSCPTFMETPFLLLDTSNTHLRNIQLLRGLLPPHPRCPETAELGVLCCSITLKHSWTLWFSHKSTKEESLWAVPLSLHGTDTTGGSQAWAACKSFSPHWRKSSPYSVLTPESAPFQMTQISNLSLLWILTWLSSSLPLHHTLSQSPNYDNYSAWGCQAIPALYSTFKPLWLFPAAIQLHRTALWLSQH